MSHIPPSSSVSTISSSIQEDQEEKQPEENILPTVLGKRKIEVLDSLLSSNREEDFFSSQKQDTNNTPSCFTTKQSDLNIDNNLQNISSTFSQNQKEAIQQKFFNYHTEAKELEKKAAQATNATTCLLYRLLSQSYSSALAMLEKVPQTDSVTAQLFEKSLYYSSLTKQEIETGHDEIALEIHYISTKLLEAGEAQSKGDSELATLYNRLAASYFYFLVAQEPRFVEHLSLEQRLGFRPDDIPQKKLIDYWANISLQNQKIIEELKTHRVTISRTSETINSEDF